jgi:hypothetical protein
LIKPVEIVLSGVLKKIASGGLFSPDAIEMAFKLIYLLAVAPA